MAESMMLYCKIMDCLQERFLTLCPFSNKMKVLLAKIHQRIWKYFFNKMDTLNKIWVQVGILEGTYC